MQVVIHRPKCSQKYRVPLEQISVTIQCAQGACRESFIASDITAPPAPAIPEEFDESIPVEKPATTAIPKPDQNTLSRDTERRLDVQRLAKDTSQKGITARQGWIIVALLVAITITPLLRPKFGSDRWEYKITSPPDIHLEEELAKLGQEGWELIEARRATSRYGNEASYEEILKRKLR